MTGFLETDRVLLRPLEPADTDGDYYDWINSQTDDELTDHARFPHSRRSLRERTESEGEDAIWLAIIERATGRHVGNIELSEIDWVHRTAKYSILVGSEAHGKGLGHDASLLLLGHAFDKLNLQRVELGVHEDNAQARALYEKLGFVEEGRRREAFARRGARRDVITMGLLAHEFGQGERPGAP